jgi:hypothetical protein
MEEMARLDGQGIPSTAAYSNVSPEFLPRRDPTMLDGERRTQAKAEIGGVSRQLSIDVH